MQLFRECAPQYYTAGIYSNVLRLWSQCPSFKNREPPRGLLWASEWFAPALNDVYMSFNLPVPGLGRSVNTIARFFFLQKPALRPCMKGFFFFCFHLSVYAPVSPLLDSNFKILRRGRGIQNGRWAGRWQWVWLPSDLRQPPVLGNPRL